MVLEEAGGHPGIAPGMLMLDVYPSEDRIVVRVYTMVKEGEGQPAILERLLEAQNSGKYLTSVGIDFPQSMRMLQKLSVVVSESTGGDTRVMGIIRNRLRPGEYAIYFLVP